MPDFNFRVGLRILPLRAAHNVNREGEIQNPQVSNSNPKIVKSIDNAVCISHFPGKSTSGRDLQRRPIKSVNVAAKNAFNEKEQAIEDDNTYYPSSINDDDLDHVECYANLPRVIMHLSLCYLPYMS